MGNKRCRIIMAVILLLVACEQALKPIDHYHPDNPKIILTREFTTADGKTTFILQNETRLSVDKIDEITSEVERNYELITNLFPEPTYEWAEEITIYLHGSFGTSFALREEIWLYGTFGDQYLLTHELTHTLLGYGGIEQDIFGVDYEHGYLTQEGLAVYLHDEYNPEHRIYPSYGVNLHKIMKHLLNYDHAIPLRELASSTTDYQYFRSDKEHIVWQSYLHAGSLVKYLVEQYGIEKFAEIYDVKQLEERILETYDQSLEELESEWHHYVQTNMEELDEEGMRGLRYLYRLDGVQ